MDEVIRDFLIESSENLDRLDREFVELERNPQSRPLLGSIFRTIHTIKGTCGFFGFQNLEHVAHAGENLLGQLRDGKRPMTPACAETLLAMVDAIRGMLACVQAAGNDGQHDYPDITATLARLVAGEEPPPGSCYGAVLLPPNEDGTPADVPQEAPSAEPVAAEPAAHESVAAPEPAPPAHAEPPAAAPPPPRAAAPRAEAEHPSPPRVDTPPADTTIRVDVSVLDQLITLVGELVLARNQAMQVVKHGDTQIQASFQRIDHVTGSLQEAVMRTRMLPVGNLFNRYPRVVRDLATQCQKQVRLDIEGADTGLDRSLLEAMKDPLTHIVRNAIDHGFETPAARVAAGKSAEGRLLLRAYHEGGRVTIEVSDDGGGINVEKVKRRAVERGLLNEARAEALSDREALEIIFMPGFSTADAVTNLSGRGVGMDVVRTNIAALGGTVDIESTFGEGTRLQLRVPLTLAIVAALIVQSGGERFAIPQVSVQELIRLPDDGRSLERIHDVPVFRLRDRLIPIVSLDQEFGLESQPTLRRCVMILAVGRQPFGLLVDAVADRMDIVVKPVGRAVGALGLFAGATVLGDGSVSLILDIAGLAERAQVLTRGSDLHNIRSEERMRRSESASYVLFRGPDDARIVVPLEKVKRIEEIPLASIERDGDGEVLQYRMHILPILRIEHLLPERRTYPRNPDVVARDKVATRAHVLVHSGPRGDVGIVVNQVLDILECSIGERRAAVRFGALFSFVVRDRVTEMLDLEAIVRKRLPGFYDPPLKKAS